VKYLVIDDDLACRDYFRNLLIDEAQCEFAVNGVQAIDMVRAALERGEPYDLLLLDAVLPDMTPVAVVDGIRNLEQGHGRVASTSVPVLLMTSSWSDVHGAKKAPDTCPVYFEKPRPIDAKQFLAKIHSCQSGASGYKTQRFLIVDDDRLCRELILDILTKFARCDTAVDGQEAVNAVRRAILEGQPYDLVCLDIMMPGMDGHSTLECLRVLEREHGIEGLQRVKVIMTTGLNDSTHCVRAFLGGCEAYVTKPVKEADLLDEIKQLGLLVPQPA
jgi:two-component system chemotaxis response regulator CheY